MMEVIKDPLAVKEFPIDWSDWLAASGATLDSSSWDLPDGITLDDDALEDHVAVALLSGGTLGDYYDVVNHIVASDGQEGDFTLRVFIQKALLTGVKDPDSAEDFRIDWSDELADKTIAQELEDDTITASEWTAGGGLSSGGDSFESPETTIRLSGGAAAGAYAEAVNSITTSRGQTLVARLHLLSREE